MFIVNIGLLYFMYEWYNLTVKYRGDWGTLGLQHIETGLFNRNYCDLFASWSMVPKPKNFHFPPCLNLGSFFYMKITFLGWSISVSIDHVILDFPMILVVSYTCAITLSLMYNGLLQIHPTQNLWIISEMRSVRVSQSAPKLSQGAPSLS